MNYIMTPNELRKALGLQPINDSHYLNSNTKTEPNNCPNCGAPITSWKCDYCDTVFDKGYIDTQKESITVKNDILLSAKLVESAYEDALKAIRRYRGCDI